MNFTKRHMKPGFAQRCREKGQVAVITALALPVLIGFTGLAFDMGLILVDRTHEQRAADAAALAGAAVLYDADQDDVKNGLEETNAKKAAEDYAAANGYALNKDTDIHTPPTSGPHKCSDDPRCRFYISVDISKEKPTHFIRMLGIKTTTVKARAVAGVQHIRRPYALIVLNPTACDAYYQSGSGKLTINEGSAIVNSNCGPETSESAFQGGSSAVATNCPTSPCSIDYYYGGEWYQQGTAVASPPPTPVKTRAEDPLELLPRPIPCKSRTVLGVDPLGCNVLTSPDSDPLNPTPWLTPNGLNITASTTVRPGVHWGGMKINATGGVVNFKPGIYIFAGGGPANGGFQYSGTIRLQVDPSAAASQGVTFFTMRDPYATVAAKQACGGYKIAGAGGLNLRAPDDPALTDPFGDTTYSDGIETILFWQDDRTDVTYGTPVGQPACTEDMDYDGGSDTVLGVIYLPEARLHVTGGGTLTGTQVIVDTFSYTGTAPFTINYHEFIQPLIPWLRLVE